MKDLYLDAENFKKGLYALEDTTKAPFGSARIMKNCQVTDRGGIGPRPGTVLLGTENTTAKQAKGLFNFIKSNGSDEILMKAYDTKVELFSKNLSTEWSVLKNTYTVDSEFDFLTTLVNADNQDYVIISNRFDPYQRWDGTMIKLSSAVSGGATSLPVTSLLITDIFESKTATGNSATTFDVSTATWATSQFVNFYVYIPSTGKIRKITANTATQITFDTLGGAPGNVAFQIRKLAIPPTGSVYYNGVTNAYTAPDVYNALPVVSATASPIDTIVTTRPTEYPGAPRGNRLTNYLGRIIVGRVRSAVALGAGSALQGYSAGGSVFVSKVGNPFDFGYSGTRIAGEGDIISMPYGGDDITDVVAQENKAYAFKPAYIEAFSYTQDTYDLAERDPQKPGFGAIGRVIRGSDDVYFATKDKKFTSLGRIASKDITLQTENIGSPIKRLLDTYDMSATKGAEYQDKLYINGKSSSTAASNDIILIYSKINKSFEGFWDLGAFGFEKWNGKFVMAESSTPNVYELLTGHADVVGTTRFPIVTRYATHFMNLTPSKANLQSLHSLYFEGYISAGTTITFNVWKDLSDTPLISFSFTGTESEFLDGQEFTAALGFGQLGVSPLGTISADTESDGRRHFQFRVYFPFKYGNFFSVGWESDTLDGDFEITRYGLGLTEDVSTNVNKVKNIS